MANDIGHNRALARIAQANKLTNVGTDSDGDDSDGFPLPPKRARSQDWNFPYDDTWGQDVVVSFFIVNQM
jgi:hypothetical protein